MTDFNQRGYGPSFGTRSAELRLQHRLLRNEQGRWIEGPPRSADPSDGTVADAGNGPSRVGEWLTERHEPTTNGHGRPMLPAETVVPPPSGTGTGALGPVDPLPGRRIDETTFPLRRTDGEVAPGPSTPIRGPMGPDTDTGRQQPGPCQDPAWNQTRYQPIEESWSQEWVERAGGDPSLGARGSSIGGPASDHNHDDDGLEAFGADGRSFDEEELDSGAAARRNAIEWAVVLVAATLLALVLRAVLLQAFYIPSPSMEDTLLIRDRVLVNKLSYRLHDINRGDIVVFHRTAAELEQAGADEPKDVIKRVIGLPGETIEISENRVLINSQVLLEPYLNESTAMPDFGPEVVPEDHIFVMGDNRNLSSDSRGELGPIETDRVVGRAFFLFWPLDRLSLL